MSSFYFLLFLLWQQLVWLSASFSLKWVIRIQIITARFKKKTNLKLIGVNSLNIPFLWVSFVSVHYLYIYLHTWGMGQK